MVAYNHTLYTHHLDFQVLGNKKLIYIILFFPFWFLHVFYKLIPYQLDLVSPICICLEPNLMISNEH